MVTCRPQAVNIQLENTARPSLGTAKRVSTAKIPPSLERDITATFRKMRRDGELHPSRIADKMYLDRTEVNTLIQKILIGGQPP
jgi:hypothetical protein